MQAKSFTETQAMRIRKAQAERDGRMQGQILVLVEIVVFVVIVFIRTHS